MAGKQRIPKVGDKVGRIGSESIYDVTYVSEDGTQANICLEGTDLEWFWVPVSTLTFPKSN